MANPLFVNWRQRSNLNRNPRELPVLPIYSETERQLPLRDRLAQFFIRYGSYGITPRAEELPEVQERLKLASKIISSETLDSIDSRLNDEAIGGIASIDASEKKVKIRQVVSEMVREGRGLEIFKKNAITVRAPNGYWNDEANRIYWVMGLALFLDKKPKDLTQDDFNANGLGGLIGRYSGSTSILVTEAFPELNKWEMRKTPKGFFDDPENRMNAVKWLVKKLGKLPEDLIGDDFEDNELAGLLACGGYSTYAVVSEAYPEIKPWEMKMTPLGFFDAKENRTNATKWLVEKLGKDPSELKKGDFNNNCLGGLLQWHDSSPYRAVAEAYPERNIMPKDMKNKPHKFA